MKQALFICLFFLNFISLNAQKEQKLWYKTPAEQWVEALPLGNGFIGAMTFGRTGTEVIQLNHTAFWSGAPHDWDNPDGAQYFPKIRDAVSQGNIEEAENLGKKQQGMFTQAFQPLGDLTLQFQDTTDIQDYYRDLNISNATSSVSYKTEKGVYQREMFISNPNNALVLRLTASKKGLISFKTQLSSQVKYKIRVENGILKIRCKAAKHSEPSYRRGIGHSLHQYQLLGAPQGIHSAFRGARGDEYRRHGRVAGGSTGGPQAGEERRRPVRSES